MGIRSAAPSDAEAIARIHVATWKATYQGILSDAYLDALTVQSSAERWSAILGNAEPGRFQLLAEDGAPRGFVSGGAIRDPVPGFSGEIYALYVAPAFQKKGYGKALFAAGLERLRAAGMPNVMVWVLKENPALRFYQACGGAVLVEKETTIGGGQFLKTGLGWLDP